MNGEACYQDKKIVQVLHYLISRVADDTADKLHLLKLVFLADRYHLRKYAQMITGDVYYAMPKGPVASRTLDILEDALVNPNAYARRFFEPDVRKKYSPFVSLCAPSVTCLSLSAREALDVALAKYAELRSREIELWDYTHMFKEWIEAAVPVMQGTLKRNLMKMETCFEDSEVEYCNADSASVALNKRLYVEG